MFLAKCRTRASETPLVKQRGGGRGAVLGPKHRVAGAVHLLWDLSCRPGLNRCSRLFPFIWVLRSFGKQLRNLVEAAQHSASALARRGQVTHPVPDSFHSSFVGNRPCEIALSTFEIGAAEVSPGGARGRRVCLCPSRGPWRCLWGRTTHEGILPGRAVACPPTLAPDGILGSVRLPCWPEGLPSVPGTRLPADSPPARDRRRQPPPYPRALALLMGPSMVLLPHGRPEDRTPPPVPGLPSH